MSDLRVGMDRPVEGTARREAKKQWEANPCGAESVTGFVPESLEWFREARRIRFEVYAPWLLEVTGIGRISKQQVLEIGVGLGSDHFVLARAGNEMTALDLSEQHLRLTNKHLELENLRGVSVCGDVENMPFRKETFDVVYAFGVLHHTDHIEAAVGEILRVLKPNGRAIISVYHRYSIFFLLRTILYNGILRAGFFREGWTRTLARIESGAGDECVPKVNVFSRRALRKIFRQFSHVKVQSSHVQADDFLYIASVMRMIPRRYLEKWLGWAGWYLTVDATK